MIKNLLIIIPLLFSHNLKASPLEEGQLSCLLEPSNEIKVSSQATGVAKHINAERGGRVKRGQLLVSLETGLERAFLELAKARYEFAKRKVNRNKELIDKELLSSHESDELLTELMIASLEVRKAEENLKQRSVYSPVDGIVKERNISPGEYVGIEPLLTLVVLDPLHAEVVMSAEYYGTIKKGTEVEIYPDDQEDNVYSGKVKIVDQVIDAASNTFGVRVELQNSKLKLPAGLKCKVRFIDEW